MKKKHFNYINTLFVVIPMTLIMAFVGLMRNAKDHTRLGKTLPQLPRNGVCKQYQPPHVVYHPRRHRKVPATT